MEGFWLRLPCSLTADLLWRGVRAITTKDTGA
jgi:hypothetical protein